VYDSADEERVIEVPASLPPMIKTETRERIAMIELARPDKKNALTAAM
jgi:enoyl-CoA hydratase/carnithine racemase